MDRHYYGEHALVVARHPSETDERMMVRILAFALHADESLQFGRGLSSEDEADLWRRDLTGAIELWVEIGLPDEKWVRKACARSTQVVLYAYGRTADAWWEQNRNKLNRLDNLTVYRLPVEESKALGDLAQRSMQLNCNIQDQEIWMSAESDSVQLVRERLHPRQ